MTLVTIKAVTIPLTFLYSYYKRIINIGIVTTDTKVLIKISFDASTASLSYILAKTAEFAAAGIAVIRTGMPSIYPSNPTVFKTPKTLIGINKSLMLITR